MATRLLSRFVVSLLPFVAACHAALPLPPAGTGDLAFRLVWSGDADLDLAVVDPSGVLVDSLHRRTTSGGVLDRDCNATPETMCAQPVENIFWPSGTAPAGTYRYRIRMVNQHTTPLPIPFTVYVLHGTRIATTSPETITGPRQPWIEFETVWPPRR